MKVPKRRLSQCCAALACSLPLLTGCDRNNDANPSPASPSREAGRVLSPSEAPSTPAQIQGKVVFEGSVPPPKIVTMNADCGKLHDAEATLTVTDYAVGRDNGLANTFVHIKQGITETYPPPEETPLLDQMGCLYNPSMLTVWAGQPFQIRNSDPLLHNVHSLPRANKEFNISQVVKGQVTPKTFDQPEALIRVRCDVHPWMICHINVVNHPFHDITDQDGNFSVPHGLPPGTYTLEAIHPKAGAVSLEITLPRSSPEPLTLTLTSK